MPATGHQQETPTLPPLTVPINTACKVLGIGRTKLYELIATKVIKTVLLGKRRLVIYSSLEALVQSVAQ